MLHKGRDIILPETLLLLEYLQNDGVLKDFFLVGGTALALQIGHRFSIDIDLFTIEAFDNQTLQDHLFLKYGILVDQISTYSIGGVIKGVKADFIRHPYPLVKPLLEVDLIWYSFFVHGSHLTLTYETVRTIKEKGSSEIRRRIQNGSASLS
jgi:hypothetical protein